VKEVQAAVAQHAVVVVGMTQPVSKKACKQLDAAGCPTTTWSMKLPACGGDAMP
jgi:hypothetical protein